MSEQNISISTDNGENWMPIVVGDSLSCTAMGVGAVCMGKSENGNAIFRLPGGQVIETDWADWIEVGKKYEFRIG